MVRTTARRPRSRVGRPGAGAAAAAVGGDAVGQGLALVAAGAWLLGHFGQLAGVAIPAWTVLGLAVGVVRPWYGLLLAAAVVPYAGGATDPPIGEVLRVVPIYGAAGRLLVERVMGGAEASVPAPWVTVAAIVAGLLYVGTFGTFVEALGPTVVVPITGAGWLLGAPTAGMAAWVVASHLPWSRERRDRFEDAMLVATAVAVVIGLLAWAGVGFVQPVVFQAAVRDRFAAFGFPTPSGMGLAVALPFAVAGALRRGPLPAAAVGAVTLLAIVLTESRGPLLALGAGAAVLVLVRRPGGRALAAVGAAAALAVVTFVVVAIGTSPEAIAKGINNKLGGDSARIASWWAGLAIFAQHPILGGGWHALTRMQGFPGLDATTIQSHNLLLHALSEGGLTLGLTYGAVLAYSVVNGWRRRAALPTSALVAAAVFLACGLWDFPQTRSYAALVGGVALGLVAVGAPRPAATPAPAADARRQARGKASRAERRRAGARG